MRLLFLCILSLISVVGISRDLRSVEEWEELFLSAWEEHSIIALERSLSNDSWQFYRLAYSLDANITMFQATGNTQYLDNALLLINNMIESAQPSLRLEHSQFKDKYLGWPSFSHRNDIIDGKEFPLYESFCWRYVSSLLRIMHQSPQILTEKHYSEQFQKILAFTETHIFDKWYTRGKENIFRSNTHMASHWARIAMNLWFITENPGRKERYWEVLHRFNYSLPNYSSSMRGQIQPNPRNKKAYWWNENWGENTLPGQDVSHGNAVIGKIIEAYELCLDWNEMDIKALINSFYIIWPDYKTFAYYLDGSGKGNGWFDDGFMKLGRFDYNLQKRLENHKSFLTPQFFANGALNARILSTGRVLYPEHSCENARDFQMAPQEVQLYPNPADEIFFIRAYAESDSYKDIHIFDLNGRLIREYTRFVNAGTNQLLFFTSEMPPGTYFVRIIGESVITHKLIISR